MFCGPSPPEGVCLRKVRAKEKKTRKLDWGLFTNFVLKRSEILVNSCENSASNIILWKQRIELAGKGFFSNHCLAQLNGADD